MEGKKAVFFDLDGTLIDSAKDLATSLNYTLKKLQLPTYEEEKIYTWIGNGAPTLVARALHNTKTPPPSPHPLQEKALKLFLEHYKQNTLQHTSLYPYAKEVLSILHTKGLKLALITNKPTAFIKPILEHFQIDSYFDLILGAQSCKFKKPHPQPLLCALEYFDITNTQAVMVGDSANDLKAALTANIESIGVDYGYNQEEDLFAFHPKAILHSLNQLPALLQIQPKVAIIGGGIAGSSLAIYLHDLGADVTLYEQKDTLVDGPPMCHLHAGGNLYREIDDSQCITLLEESIELLKLYPYGVDFRPTIIATPKNDPISPKSLLPRLQKLQQHYQEMIVKDPTNKVLGEVEEYYKVFSKEELLQLKDKVQPKEPKTFQEWLIPFAKEVDLETLRYPVIAVAEYGLNIFRLSASVTALIEQKQIKTRLGTKVSAISQQEDAFYINNEEKFDYLINAAGFQSGVIDDMLGYHTKRYVEFKAAYVTHWETPYKWPEVIFHGLRGTPQGMGQFTPYPNNYFQLHGMTKEITLYEDSLVESSQDSAQPQLPQHHLKKIFSSWDQEEIQKRTQNAIAHISNYIPAFYSASVGAQPLFGAQQIPGEDASLRAAEISFEGDRYARCEIVKASTIYTMADGITKKLISLGYFSSQSYKKRFVYDYDQKKITQTAKRIAKERNYPPVMGEITTPKEVALKN